MVSSSQINNKKDNFEKLLLDFGNEVIALEANWQGNSFDNLKSESREFLVSANKILHKLENFAQALDLYKSYKEAKTNYNLLSTKISDLNPLSPSYAYQKEMYQKERSNIHGNINNYKKRINKLLTNINTELFSNVKAIPVKDCSIDKVKYLRGKMLDIANAQVGVHETGNNNVKFNTWYYGHPVNGATSDDYAWCSAFVSWVADQNGIPTDVIPRTASCETATDFFKAKGRFKEPSEGYIPQRGDIIYFDNEPNGVPNHVGIVEKVENGVVYTIEGNKNNQCQKCSYSLNQSTIMGYGVPDYSSVK